MGSCWGAATLAHVSVHVHLDNTYDMAVRRVAGRADMNIVMKQPGIARHMCLLTSSTSLSPVFTMQSRLWAARGSRRRYQQRLNCGFAHENFV